MTKQLAATEPVPEMMFFAAVFTSLITLGPALWVWQTPSWEQLALIAAMGIVGSIGQLWLIWSLSEGEATLTGPMEYVRIIFAAGFGFLIFSEIPTVWTGVGSLIIVSSTVYIAWREAVLGKRRVPPADPH
jgi:drug/metabolite transporter (DMT)-like permease